MTTLIVYPDASSGATTCDGAIARATTSQTLSAIIAGAGTGTDLTATTTLVGRLRSSTTSNQYAQLWRAGFTFDTSSIPSGATISSATFSLYGTAKSNALGDAGLDVVGFTPAAYDTFANTDFANFGGTVKATKAYSALSTTNYNGFALAAADITKADITALGTRLTFDTSGTGPTWASAVNSDFTCYYADQTGTANDPMLTVVYYNIAPHFMFYARQRSRS